VNSGAGSSVTKEHICSGAARDTAPWKFYDLGHSYCTNAFRSTCPHRITCVGCSFNLPKNSAKAMAVEARASVARLLEEVPLSPDERAAAEGDITALNGMLAKLRDVPALDGRTPPGDTLRRRLFGLMTASDPSHRASDG
jgi:hypothetical protein